MFKLFGGVAVLLVLLFHLFRIEEKYIEAALLSDHILAGISGVGLFFVSYKWFHQWRHYRVPTGH